MTAPNALANVRIVLVAPTHPGNVGAAARAMRTMGLRDLRLVRPRRFPSAEATERAAGAFDVLDRAQVVGDLAEALADCRWAVAATARPRRLEWDRFEPAEAARELIRRAASGPVAAVFGRESAGLSNQEIDQCRAVLRIPTDPGFRSLNVAAAVQIVTYEVARAAAREAAPAGNPGAGGRDSFENERESGDGNGGGRGGRAGDGGGGGAGARRAAVTTADLERLFSHFEQVLIDVGYLDPARPRLLMRRLRRLVVRADLDAAELAILRGILTAAQRAAGAPGSRC